MDDYFFTEPTRLFTKEVIKSDIFEKIGTILKSIYNQKNNFITKRKEIIDYKDFKYDIQELVILIMKTISKDNVDINKRVSCSVLTFMLGMASFDKKNNEVKLRDELVREIYNGDIIQIATIFHEVYHFIIKYDILMGKTNEIIVNCLKEVLLESIYSNYYVDNYGILFEENYVDIKGISEFMNLMNIIQIDLTKKDIKRLLNTYFNAKDKYQYYNRHIDDNISNITFHELFDLKIVEHPEWLKYFQLNFEYYIDNEGNINKRNREQLRELLNYTLKYKNQEFANYILFLIDKIDKQEMNRTYYIKKY